MNNIDFTQNGGFPLTQDVLAFMQAAYSGPLNALGGILGGGTNIPHVISGCTYTVTGSLYIVQAGYIWYNGELFYFPGGSIVVSMDNAVFQIQETDTPLTYYDTSTHNSMQVRQLGLTLGNGSGTTWFQVSLLHYYGKEPAETFLPVSSIGVSGSMYYRKNFSTNTLQIRGSLTVNVTAVAATGTLTGPIYVTVQSLPSGYIPNNNVPFKMYYYYHDAPILEDTGKDYIKDINAQVDTSGNITAGLIKSAANYVLYFNTIIPLD